MKSFLTDEQQTTATNHHSDPVAALVEWFRLSTLEGKNLQLYSNLIDFIKNQDSAQRSTQATLPNFDSGDQKTVPSTLQTNALLIRILDWLNKQIERHATPDESFFIIIETFIMAFPAYSIYLSENIHKNLPHWTKRFGIAEQYKSLSDKLTLSQKLKSLSALDAKDHKSCLDTAIDEMINLKNTFLLNLSQEEIQIIWSEMSESDRKETYDKLLSLPSFRTGNDKTAISIFEKHAIKPSKLKRAIAYITRNPELSDQISDDTFAFNKRLLYILQAIYPCLTPTQKIRLVDLLYHFLKAVFSDQIYPSNIYSLITTIMDTSFMLVDFQDEAISSCLLDLIEKNIKKYTTFSDICKPLLAYFLLGKIKISLAQHASLLSKYHDIWGNPLFLSTHFFNVLIELTHNSNNGTRDLAYVVFPLFFKYIHERLMTSEMKGEPDITFLKHITSLLDTHFSYFTNCITTQDRFRKGDNHPRRLAACKTSAAILPYLMKFPVHRQNLVDSLLNNKSDERICLPTAVCKALAVAHRYPLEKLIQENKPLDSWNSFTACEFKDINTKMAMRAAQYTLLITNSVTPQSSKSIKAIRKEMIAYCTDEKRNAENQKTVSYILTKIFLSLNKDDPARSEILAALLNSLLKTPISNDQEITICDRFSALSAHFENCGKQDQLAEILGNCLLLPGSHNRGHPYQMTYRLLGNLFPYVDNKTSIAQLPDVIKIFLNAIKTLSSDYLTPYVIAENSIDQEDYIRHENLKVACEVLITAAMSLTPRQKNILISDLVTVLKKNPCAEILLCLEEIITPHLQEEALTYHLQPEMTSIVTSYLTPGSRRR